MTAENLRQIRLVQSFSHAVAVLMRDKHFAKLPLGDLEWLVLPPLGAGQFRLAHLPKKAAPQSEAGILFPVALALWARVSPAVDKMLSENLDAPVRLRPDQWVSGDQLWLMLVAGDPRAVPRFLEELEKTEFNGKGVKQRRRGPDGKVVVVTLGQGA